MTTLIDAPTRVDGVQLIGDMVGSGYRTAPALVRRDDGQVLQLTPLLYRVLDAADGRRSPAEIAAVVSRALGRSVSAADVDALVNRHLRPLGLLLGADGSAPELKRSDPLLGLKPRVVVTSPRVTRRLTDPFRFLFRPVVVVPVLVAFLAVVLWVFFERGLGASAYEAFERPHLLVLVFVVTVISGGLHEFGHAAANRYSGGVPGAMGAGLYLVWPAFYTDVTDSYRLGRMGRIRTDLGGLYFNAVVVVLTFVWWWATGWEALLLLVATQILQMVTQLLPLLRFDGYHVLADVAGVPDLYQRIKPTLAGLLPHRWNAPEQRLLTPRARVLITLWVLVTVPLMAFMLYAMVRAVPRLLGSAGSALGEDAAALAEAAGSGQFLDVAGHGLEALGVVVPVLACVLVLGRVGFRLSRGLVRWGRASTMKRVAAAAMGAVLIAGLAWAWWPGEGSYRPIQQDERGTLTALFLEQPQSIVAPTGASATEMGTAAGNRLSSGEPLVAAFEKGAALPTKDDPTLAMVLVPAEGSGHTPEDTWVFPFDKPLPPAEGDNQAIAVATDDGSVVYDLAFALVWADDDEVLNVNEAHAYASCSDCVAVAVAFQVVLIVDDAQVVVPQNLAVAANYDCYNCITAAIANQLILSVAGEPSDEQLRALGEVWNDLIRFAHGITSYSLTEITQQLETFKAEIVEILGQAPPVQPAPDTSPLDEPAPPGTTPPMEQEPSTSPPSPSTEPSPNDPSPAPAPVPEPTPAPDPVPEPTPEPTPPAP
ncbi:hypothetical protein [Agromyces ramosus]|uniref:Peptide zinc metalloprotease protein n=1 Tax=Agromyces ramosus TaxID=33879 RepID=A0ABU0RD87_9MICO|nr:hypothetical protein [Agromyces ramosus]MDQ0896041.1 putative peptide zinc metalloprotease protein [Agromyces ramosus]